MEANDTPLLPNRILLREVAVHLRDADLSRPDELGRLAHVAHDLGLDLDVELALISTALDADKLSMLNGLADMILS